MHPGRRVTYHPRLAKAEFTGRTCMLCPEWTLHVVFWKKRGKVQAHNGMPSV